MCISYFSRFLAKSCDNQLSFERPDCRLKDIVGIFLFFSYDIMKLYRMWNVIVSTYDCNSSVHLFFLIFQHIRCNEIIKQKIP